MGMTHSTTARPSHPHHPAFSALLALAAFGCQRPAHDLGQTSDELGAPPAPPVQQAQFLADFIGTWEGDMDDALGIGADGASPTVYAFPSGSSRLLLELQAGERFMGGTLTFGEGDPLPPPTDPDVGYPADPSYEFNGHFDSSDIPPFEGFAYELAVGADPGDVRRANPPPSPDELPADDDDSDDDVDVPTRAVAFDGKVELAFTLDAPFAPWCELQTDDLCNQVNGIGTGSDDPEQCYASVGFGSVPMDCHKAEICAGEHCRFEHRTTLDLRFSNDGLTGAFNDLPLFNERGFRTRPGTVRFRRVTTPAAVNP
jgi:hypothetical protein